MPTTPITQQLAEKLIDAALDSDASGRPDGALADLALQLRASYRQRAEAPGQEERPVVVAPDADAHEMNRLHGESYGVDWVYPRAEQPAQAPAVPAPLPEQAEGARPVAMPDEAQIDEYLDGYVFEGDEGCYTPSENEQFLIKDAILGLLSMMEEGFGPAVPWEPAVQPLVQREVVREAYMALYGNSTFVGALSEATPYFSSRGDREWLCIHYRSRDDYKRAREALRLLSEANHQSPICAAPWCACPPSICEAESRPADAQDHRRGPIEHADRIEPESISAVPGAMQEAGAAEAVKLVPIVPTPEMVFALLAVPEIDDAKADIEAMWAAMLAASPKIDWPKPPSRRGQSPVLFDDGYEEGWAKCIDTLRKMVSAPSAEYGCKHAAPPTAQAAARGQPVSREVGRVGDMAPPEKTHMRVLLDCDNDACVEIWDAEHGEGQRACIEFCTAFGGGKSPRTREALVALMVAMEADNAACPRGKFPPAHGIGPSDPAGEGKTS